MKTQNDMILAYLRAYGSITPQDALREFGCMRLSARIYDLKKRGESISEATEHSKNKFGKDVAYSRYRLEKGCVSS